MTARVLTLRAAARARSTGGLVWRSPRRAARLLLLVRARRGGEHARLCAAGGAR